VSQEIMARDLPLPPLWGVGNDYSFLQEELSRRGTLSSLDGYKPAFAVSIVITVHNRAHLLRLCLESLALQDYPQDLYEIIVVDDKSSDDPLRQIESAGLPVRFIKAPLKAGHTEGTSRNIGIRAAIYPVILQMDPDVLFENRDALRWIARWFDGNADVAVTVSRTFIGAEGISPQNIRDETYPKIPTGDHDGREILRRDPDILKHRYLPYLEVLGFCMAYRRSSAFAAGLYSESWNEYGGVDQEFAYRLYERGAYCVHEQQVHAYHLHHPYVERTGAHRDFMAKRIPPYRVHRYPGRYRGRIDTPRCSIYIPVRNGAQHLGEALDSAFGQTFRDLEVVVVDDGSSDRTPEILCRKAHEDSRLRWLQTPPQGCASASNTAIRHARGEFILQLDADDVLHPCAAERMIAEFDRQPWLGLVFARLMRTNTALVPERPSESFKNYRRHQTLLCMHASAPRMWRRRLHFLVGGHDETLTSAVDYDIVLRISERAPLHYLDEVLYYYRIRRGSLSSDTERQRENGLTAVRRSLQRMGLDTEFDVRLNLSLSNRWYSYVRKAR